MGHGLCAGVCAGTYRALRVTRHYNTCWSEKPSGPTRSASFGRTARSPRMADETGRTGRSVLPLATGDWHCAVCAIYGPRYIWPMPVQRLRGRVNRDHGRAQYRTFNFNMTFARSYTISRSRTNHMIDDVMDDLATNTGVEASGCVSRLNRNGCMRAQMRLLVPAAHGSAKVRPNKTNLTCTT